MTDAGWEHYPKRLRNYDPLREDGGSYDDRLTNAEEEKRLFMNKGSMSIDVLDVNRDEFFADNKKPETYEDAETFEACLTTPTPAKREARFYYLKAANKNVISRSRLHIPRDTLRKLLTVHQVMPGFVDFLQAFGRKISGVDSAYGGCKRRIQYTSPAGNSKRSIESYEICYNIKSAEKNGRLENDPWSIRQTCIYQKFEYSKKSSTWILVQPSDKVQRRLEEVFKGRTTEDIEDSVHNPLDIHLVFLSASSENWRWYYNLLEEQLMDMTQSAVHATVDNRKKPDPNAVTIGTFSEDFEVTFRDVQNLQKFEEKVQALYLALETNRDTIVTVQRHNLQLQKYCPEMEEHLFTSVDDSLDTYLTELVIHKRNVEALLHRIRGRSRLLYNILDFRNAQTAHRHGQKNVDFAELSRRDSDLMMTMTKRTTREAVAVKIVTFVTLFYLPATFVATFLSANCVKFVDEVLKDGRTIKRMTVEKDMILFAAITVPLTCLTLSVWYIWNRKAEDIVREETGDKKKSSGLA